MNKETQQKLADIMNDVNEVAQLEKELANKIHNLNERFYRFGMDIIRGKLI